MAELTPEELAYAERQQKEYEAFVERDPTFSERFEATLGDIGTGLKEAPAQILRGAQEGLNAASDASHGIAEWLNKNVINLDGVANAIGVTEDKNHLRFSDGAMPAKPASVTGTLVNDVSQFVTGFVTAGRFLKVVGVAPAASVGGAVAQGMVKGAITDATVFDPHEERLSNLIQSYPRLANPITEYLAADPSDGAGEGRLKNALEGLAIGGVVGASSTASGPSSSSAKGNSRRPRAPWTMPRRDTPRNRPRP